MECLGNCLECQWQKTAKVDDVFFCQNMRIFSCVKKMQLRIEQLAESISDITNKSGSTRDTSNFPIIEEE